MPYPPLFKGTVLNGQTQYIGIPTGDCSLLGIHIVRKDGAAPAALALEQSNFDSDEAPVTTAGTYQWEDTGEVIADPGVAGATFVNLGNVGGRRTRLKITSGAADTQYEVRGHRKL